MGDLVERAAAVMRSVPRDEGASLATYLHEIAQALSDAGMLAEWGKTTDGPVIYYTPYEGWVPDYFLMRFCTIEPSQNIATATVRHLSPEEARDPSPLPQRRSR